MSYFKRLPGVILFLAICNPLFSQVRMQPAPATSPKIQVALLLDVSGSMEGLINQARAQLWNMVRILGSAECRGGRPTLEIALYAYGNVADLKTDFVRMVVPFTSNLDSLSGALFSLSAGGSDEYCGLAIHRAVSELNWDERADSYKTIFIAGNESFEEGPVLPSAACAEARAKELW